MKRLIAVVLIISMIFTTGGFVALADSVSDVVATSVDRSSLEDIFADSEGANDDAIGANPVSVGAKHREPADSEGSDADIVGANPDIVGANSDIVEANFDIVEANPVSVGANFVSPDDERINLNEIEEPEVDETTVLSDGGVEPTFDETETTTVEVTTEELNFETTTKNNTSEEPTSQYSTTEQASATLVPTTAPTIVVPLENTSTESTNTVTDSEISDAENQTKNNISTSSDVVEDTKLNSTLTDIELNKEVATNSEALEISLASNSETININLQEVATNSETLEISLASNSETINTSLQDVGIASFSEISLASSSQLFGEDSFPSHFWFGTYPQSDASGLQLEPIKWIVLEHNENEAILTTEKIFDCVNYKVAPYASKKWSDSYLRSWANSVFKERAFTTSQFDGFASKHLSTVYNEAGDVEETDDSIYILSSEEVEHYFPTIAEKKVQGTVYAKNVDGGCLEVNQFDEDHCSRWWVRNTSDDLSPQYGWNPYVDYDGYFNGQTVAREQMGVGFRPVIAINLNSSIIKTSSNRILGFNLNGASWWSEESRLWGYIDTYQGGQKLPTTENLILPDGKYLAGWTYSDDPDTLITEIAPDKTGDIFLIAKIVDGANITWDLTDGNTGNSGAWNGQHGPSRYGYGIGLSVLPTNVTGPEGKQFDHWEIDGTRVSSITSTKTGNITIKAVYKDFNYIWYGTYPQNDSTGVQAEPIKWRIIKNQYGKLTLIADKVLYATYYNETVDGDGRAVNVEWRDSNLRNWLNNTFLNDAFTTFQTENRIIENTINTEVQSSTTDKVFLLSEAEAYSYSVDVRKSEQTNYAKEHNGGSDLTWYWLRGYYYDNDGDYVGGNDYRRNWGFNVNLNTGEVASRNDWAGAKPYYETKGIRPLICLDVYKSQDNNVTFNLNGGSWKNGSTLWRDYDRYQHGQKLPDKNNIDAPAGMEFFGWTYNGGTEIITEIPETIVGDLNLKAVYVPAIIWFGTYPQNDTTGNQKEPVAWKVLGKYGDEVVLIADKILDNVSYHNTLENTNWKDSHIRNWLNNEFKNNIFTTDSADGLITDKTISTLHSDDTIDKIYLLSYEEAEKYFVNAEARTVSATEYAKNKLNGGETIQIGNNGKSPYWLREPVDFSDSQVKYFAWDGNIDVTGDYVNAKNRGVRPVISIDYSNFRYNDNTVTWDMQSFTWKTESALWGEYNNYHPGQKLPTTENINAPIGRSFIGFVYSEDPHTIITEIDQNKTGNIILRASYSSANYNITWNLGSGTSAGHWNSYAPPSSYVIGDEIDFKLLHLSNYIIPPVGKEFDHFEIGGVEATKINATDYGDKEVVAVYRLAKQYLWLGTYPQNDASGVQEEPIKWRILSQDGNEATLIAENILDNCSYDSVFGPTSWAESSIIKFLSWNVKSFLYSAFTKNQIDNALLVKNIQTEDSSDTSLKVFLLSIDEVGNYFINNDDKKAKATTYAKNVVNDGERLSVDTNGYSPWWLRSPGETRRRASLITINGTIDMEKTATSEDVGVRPAITIDLSSSIIKTSNNGISFNLNGSTFKRDSFLWGDMTTYQGGQKLPTVLNLDNIPEGKTLAGWAINNNLDNVVAEIPIDQTGDIVLSPVFITIPDTIWFGTYPQGDANGVQKEPIKWRAISKEGTKALYVAEKVLDNVSYHTESESPNWKDSSIRTWLDEDFRINAFTNNQINDVIVSKTISTDNENTNDRVFLLTVDDATNYFTNNQDRRAKASNYAKNVNNGGETLLVDATGFSSWWLRTRVPAGAYDVATQRIVNSTGDVGYAVENFAHTLNIGVRPAFYVNLLSNTLKTSDNNITFNLNGASWKTGSTLWNEMTTYQGGQKLPTADNLDNIPAGKTLAGWTLNGNPDVVIREIPKDQTGDIVLTPAYKNVLPSTIWFGAYLQGYANKGTHSLWYEPIKWRVLWQNGEEALLLSDTILLGAEFDDANENWANSDIRKYLNETFINDAFSDSQKNSIVSKTIMTDNEETSDKIFILSRNEVETYFSDENSRRAVISNKAVSEYLGQGTEIPTDSDNCASWWLRDKYRLSIMMTMQRTINSNGEVGAKHASSHEVGVRPAMYVNLNSGLFRDSNNHVTFELNEAYWADEERIWPYEFDAYQGGQPITNPGRTGLHSIRQPYNKQQLGWVIQGTDEFITEIPANQTGDIVLEMKLGTSYDINWELNGGTWDDYAYIPLNYVSGVGIEKFPVYVNGPQGKVFSHWEMNGVTVNGISKEQTGPVTINAIYEDVPDYVWYGVYPQNDTSGNQLEPIKWKPLKKIESYEDVFLISEKVLDNDKRYGYNTENYSDAWPYSTIRSWLNDGFKNIVFSTYQYENGVVETPLITFYHRDEDAKLFPRHSFDKIFLISKEEAGTISVEDRKSAHTRYSASNYDGDIPLNDYWLRGHASEEHAHRDWPALVNINTGEINLDVSERLHSGVRPSIYLNNKEPFFKYKNNRVTWDLNGGSWKNESILWAEYDRYQIGQKLPTSANINPPNGETFKGFVISGTSKILTEIPEGTEGDITLKALYSSSLHQISYDLRDEVTNNNGSWVGVAGPSSYVQGVGIDTLPTNVKGPEGREFDHWEIDGAIVTGISDTASGNKTIKAVYRNASCDIHWALSGGSWESGYTAPTSYVCGTGLDLTEATNKYISPNGMRLSRWLLQFEGETTAVEATSISITASKKVTIIAECTSAPYNITYVDESNNPITWNGTPGPATYEKGVGITYIPTNVNAPVGLEFDHWEIGGVQVDSIAHTASGDKTVVAKFKNKKYKITWQLYTDIGFLNPDGEPIILRRYGDWTGEAGADSYTYGEGYTLPGASSVETPPGYSFAGWQFMDPNAMNPIPISGMITEISSTDSGDKLIVAVFDDERYNIRWNLNGVTMAYTSFPGSYTYGNSYVQDLNYLPDLTNPDVISHTTVPAGKEISHWAVNGVPATVIPRGTMGDITITLVLTDVPSHGITWEYGTGENHWSFDGWTAPDRYYEGAGLVFPDKSFVSVTNGRELDYFTVDGVQATEIASTSTVDVTVSAVLKNKTYRIKYNIGSGEWDGAEGAISYTYGTPYTLPTNIKAPRGKEFDHWEIGSSTATSISATDYGHKEYTAIYRNKTYNIIWNLKGATIPYATPSYTYGTEVILPVDSDIVGYEGRRFAYWTVNGVRSTKIEATQIDEVIVVLHYLTYPIIWELDGGQFVNYTKPTSYYSGVGITLPDSSKVVPPNNYLFDYFTVNNVAATEIDSNIIGDVTVRAVYKEAPPTPTPPAYRYITSINVKNTPNKLSYVEGNRLDLAGLVITTNYNDNTSEDIEYNDTTRDNFQFIPSLEDALTTSNNEVLILYSGKSASYNITVAVNLNPVPTPTPYNPGGNGGNSGGSGGIGGSGNSTGPIANNDIAPAVTKINQLKYIKAAADSRQVAWVYEPITNKFKMNINIGEQTIPASDGFYLVSKNVEQNVNGTTITVPTTATYYFDREGNMVTGWIKTIDNKWCYMNSTKNAQEGMMVFGWYQIQSKWYYFIADGTMLVNATTPDGFVVGADGAWVQ